MSVDEMVLARLRGELGGDERMGRNGAYVRNVARDIMESDRASARKEGAAGPSSHRDRQRGKEDVNAHLGGEKGEHARTTAGDGGREGARRETNSVHRSQAQMGEGEDANAHLGMHHTVTQDMKSREEGVSGERRGVGGGHTDTGQSQRDRPAVYADEIALERLRRQLGITGAGEERRGLLGEIGGLRASSHPVYQNVGGTVLTLSLIHI